MEKDDERGPAHSLAVARRRRDGVDIAQGDREGMMRFWAWLSAVAGCVFLVIGVAIRVAVYRYPNVPGGFTAGHAAWYVALAAIFFALMDRREL